MEILEKEDFVDETSIFGNQIHIIVNDKFKNKDVVKNILNRNSIDVARIDKIVPTLEDVFIHLLEKK
jgi:ABC-2 type transport system ATP-binding protein